MNTIKIFWNTYFDFCYSAALCVGAVLFSIVSYMLYREREKKRIKVNVTAKY